MLEEREAKKDTYQVNNLQLLSAFSFIPQSCHYNLMHMVVKINEVEVFTMLAIEATNNFISTKLATKLGLIVTKSDSDHKTVNAEARVTEGASTTRLEFHSWTNQCKFSVIPLDDFEVVLGLESLVKEKISLILHLNGVMVNNKTTPCFVRGITTNLGSRNNRFAFVGPTKS